MPLKPSNQESLSLSTDQETAYQVALAGLNEMSDSSSYAISKIPHHKPSKQTDNMLHHIEYNLRHAQWHAEFECKIYSNEADKFEKLQQANYEANLGTVRVQETIDAINAGLSGKYDIEKSIQENFLDLKKSIDNKITVTQSNPAKLAM
jgi:hypothetical protein